MDEDTRELIRRLCTRAGMIMEDASAVAVLAPQEERLDDLRRAAEQISNLLAAARTLRDG
jgi:threonine synthase